MQINGTSSGPTMAASEPPEPPPRNPERINASLQKLGDSKNIRSLDTTTSDKIVNNNKPLKAILSLDNSFLPPTRATTGPPAVHAPILPAGRDIAYSASTPTATATATTVPPGSVNKRCDSSVSTPKASGGVSSSSLNSNGGNQTFSSHMTSDNQLLHQQPQQSVGFASTSDMLATHSNDHQSQQQQQQQQQPINGAANMNNLNVLPPNQAGLPTAVDKRNANDVCLSGQSTIMELSSPLTLDHGPRGGGADQSNRTSGADYKNPHGPCDGNSNNELKVKSFTESPPTKLLEENDRLNAEIHRLRKLLENSPEGAVGGIDLSDSNSCGDAQSTDGSGTGTSQQRAERLEAELRSTKSQLMTLRIERKKLRADKSDLLNQVKQLCSSLEEKEQELRDFIRNFQERVRETESNNAKLSGDRERERWQLLKQARDEAERSLALAQQLNTRDLQLQRLQEQLAEARRQLSGCLSDQESLLSFAPLTPPSATSGMLGIVGGAGVTGSGSGTGSTGIRTDDSGRANSNSLSAFSGSSGVTTGDRNSCSNDSGLRNSSDRESTAGDLNFSDGTCDNGPCITVDPDSISLVSSQNMYQFGTPKDRSPTLSPLNSAAYSRSVEQLGSPVDSEALGAVTRKFTPKTGTLSGRNGRGGTWGSISRVFARSRNKSKALSADGAMEYADFPWNPLTEEGYAEKLRLLREASQLPMERWRASQVLAWLEVALGMPQYSTRCAENVKSGKVLLELNDGELEAGLGLAHPMHRKKLRLAIEEQRRPEMVRYPMITQLGHTWVASEWLPDIGLPQYAESFLHSLVDARMLDTLSKKELEKFLGVTRKFHQASIVHGIHVLRIVKYDRQTLAIRRVQSETVDTDPIVWTNQRFVRWARTIDLGEYAENLKDSGVHGGLVVLEPSFSGDTMATALGIPSSKNIIRRHLSTEFDALILPARATLGQGIRSGCGVVPITGPGGLQHYATTDRRSTGSLRISAWKGSQSSLSKAFRFKNKSSRGNERGSFGNSTSPTPSYSSSEGGGGIYATVGPLHYPPPTTAPPPPPIGSQYGPAGHRVSAPPMGCVLESVSDPDFQCEQQKQRRVKSISDIGLTSGTPLPD